MKEYNTRRHYTTKGSRYESYKGQLRNNNRKLEKGTNWAPFKKGLEV